MYTKKFKMRVKLPLNYSRENSISTTKSLFFMQKSINFILLVGNLKQTPVFSETSSLYYLQCGTMFMVSQINFFLRTLVIFIDIRCTTLSLIFILFA